MPLLLLFLTLFGAPQEPKPVPPVQDPPNEQQQSEDEPTFQIGVAVNQVFLSVTARSTQGGFYKGLIKEDFKIFEDGLEQEVVNFIQEAVPVKVVLLIDSSGSTRHSQASIRRAALEFAKSLDEEDEIAVITFNDLPVLIANWTNDIKKIETALSSIYAKGPTVMNDALYVTFDDLLRDVPGKKAVILLTDGVDTRSSVSFDSAMDLAIRSEAIVYVASKLDEYWAGAISMRSQYASRGLFVPKELTDRYILQVRRELKEMTEMTGGRILESQAFDSLGEVYRIVAEELKNQYYLSYTPSNTVPDGRWREIEVRVRRPGVVTKTRPGYFADSPPTGGSGR